MTPETAFKTPAIAEDSLILITGVTGYIASHIANELLARGYRVRGTVRDVEESRWVSELFEGKFGKGRFETATLTDMAKPGVFDEAVKGLCPKVSHSSLSGESWLTSPLRGALKAWLALCM